MTRQRVGAIDVDRDVHDAYNDEIQQAMQDTVWLANCNNYYRHPNGKVVTQLPYSGRVCGASAAMALPANSANAQNEARAVRYRRFLAFAFAGLALSGRSAGSGFRPASRSWDRGAPRTRRARAAAPSPAPRRPPSFEAGPNRPDSYPGSAGRSARRSDRPGDYFRSG